MHLVPPEEQSSTVEPTSWRDRLTVIYSTRDPAGGGWTSINKSQTSQPAYGPGASVLISSFLIGSVVLWIGLHVVAGMVVGLITWSRRNRDDFWHVPKHALWLGPIELPSTGLLGDEGLRLENYAKWGAQLQSKLNEAYGGDIERVIVWEPQVANLSIENARGRSRSKQGAQWDWLLQKVHAKRHQGDKTSPKIPSAASLLPLPALPHLTASALYCVCMCRWWHVGPEGTGRCASPKNALCSAKRCGGFGT